MFSTADWLEVVVCDDETANFLAPSDNVNGDDDGMRCKVWKAF